MFGCLGALPRRASRLSPVAVLARAGLARAAAAATAAMLPLRRRHELERHDLAKAVLDQPHRRAALRALLVVLDLGRHRGGRGRGESELPSSGGSTDQIAPRRGAGAG